MSGRIAILASGEGTNAQALIDASNRGELAGGEVVVLVSDRPDAPALRRARDADVEALFIDPTDYAGRAAYGSALAQALSERDVDLVCLAGFMRILAPTLVRPFENRILNVHPALLPAFPGAKAVRDAIEWGAKVVGVTVHFVDEEMDHGPIVFQESLDVEESETEEHLHARLKEIEHRLYPEAVRAVLTGRVKVEGRHVTVAKQPAAGRASADIDPASS